MERILQAPNCSSGRHTHEHGSLVSKALPPGSDAVVVIMGVDVDQWRADKIKAHLDEMKIPSKTCAASAHKQAVHFLRSLHDLQSSMVLKNMFHAAPRGPEGVGAT
mmetsp:Transcript_1716/g.2479  ORF Transcript_1716/g.2479 Transcript_1716/m.2479 type:complete len:106 (+) Transcript_1716:45-362(+)